jgi:hypothetical protein
MNEIVTNVLTKKSARNKKEMETVALDTLLLTPWA